MKRPLNFLVLIFTLCILAFTLTACGQNPHSHDYAELKYNATEHWYECECGEKSNVENHSGGTATCTTLAECSVCGEGYGEYSDHTYEKGKCDCGAIDPTYMTEGLVFSLVNNGTEYEVSGYTGTSIEVYIPSTHNDKPVTSIGGWAFSGCISLQGIEIPNSVTSIGYNAFSGCDSLQSIEIPASVTSIGYGVFYNCYSLQNVTFGENSQLTSIGDYAFSDCYSLTSIEIPNSVTSIGVEAFFSCYSLQSVTFGENSQLTSIGNYAFSGCCRLVEVINKSEHITVTKGSSDNGRLGYYALSVSNREDNYVSKLSTDANNFVIYTEGEEKILVNYIGNETDITISNGITKINNYAFYDCSSLRSVVIGDSVTSIGDDVFYYCTSLTSIEIPDSVTKIGAFAFYNCWSLQSIEIPDSVTSIGHNAFSSCDNLTSVTFGENSQLTSIGYGSFHSCDSLTSIEIPSSVTSIGIEAFFHCSSLQSIEIPSSVTSIGECAFEGCYLLRYNEKDGFKYLGNSNNPYLYLSHRIDENITSASIDNNCKIIGSQVFSNCTSLTSIEIPDSVTSIGDWAFDNCNNLTSVTFGENSQLTSIGSFAFYDCESLTSIEIPASVTSIGDRAFYSCDNLTTIYCEAESKPSGWNGLWSVKNWDGYNHTVIWGYKGEN